MNTPTKVSDVLEKLRTYCPDFNVHKLHLVNEEEDNFYLSLNFSLNLFLQMALIEHQKQWTLPAESAKNYTNLVKNHQELIKLGFLEKQGKKLLASKSTINLLCQEIHNHHPNHTAFSANGDLIYKLSVPQEVIHFATRIVREKLWKGNKGLKVVCEIGDEGAALTIGQLRILRFFHITYEPDKQICLYGLLNYLKEDDKVILIAKYGNYYHVFLAEYDIENDIYGPVYFVHAIKVQK